MDKDRTIILRYTNKSQPKYIYKHTSITKLTILLNELIKNYNIKYKQMKQS